MPSRDELLRYVADSPGELSKRDLARAFQIKGQDRTELKRLLRELERDGALARGQRRRVRPQGRLPSVAVLDVAGMDADGELLARPAKSAEDEAPPRILLLDGERRGAALEIGDRVLARLIRVADGEYHARVIRILPRPPRRVVGVVEQARDGLRIRPLDAKARFEFHLEPEHAADAGPGELVVADPLAQRALGLPRAKVIERLGAPHEPRAISLIAAHSFDLPLTFPREAEEQAAQAEPVALGKRTDLRGLPLVTIDGADARDFDDAVWAAPDDHPGNPGGWQAVVAIADVAHYVRPGDPLDREARRRGNSVYFPDRVLPMLPEPLSNGLCSLRPDEDRACLAVRMWFDRRGRKLRHRFERALMRSRARLTYEQIQAAADGSPDELTAPLLDDVVRPLFGAFGALLEARRQRGTLDLDLPEIEVRFDDQGRPHAIARRNRLDAHRLIEEFMIAANVAAAETLEPAPLPCMYRIHDRPDAVKLEALGQLLDSLGITRSRANLAKPKDLAQLLERLSGHALAPMISTLVLRAQSQAVYSPDNIGHFGLNLGRYAHFTSPIRRYADLVVHRALISALRLGAGGLEDGVTGDDWRELGAAISRTERRAMEAERNAQSRFLALVMTEQVGSAFAATITSVQRFGVFVQLDDTLAEGLVPMGALGAAGYVAHDPARHALIDEGSGTAMALGDRVRVELTEVDVLIGQLTFRLLDHTPGPAAQAVARSRRNLPKRRGPPRRRTTRR
jgi:ribonuclease R